MNLRDEVLRRSCLRYGYQHFPDLLDPRQWLSRGYPLDMSVVRAVFRYSIEEYFSVVPWLYDGLRSGEPLSLSVAGPSAESSLSPR